jgi:hypothetical protein
LFPGYARAQQLNVDTKTLDAVIDFWGRAYFFHPILSETSFRTRYELHLADCLDSLKHVRSKSDIARIVTATLVNPLEDPFTQFQLPNFNAQHRGGLERYLPAHYKFVPSTVSLEGLSKSIRNARANDTVVIDFRVTNLSQGIKDSVFVWLGLQSMSTRYVRHHLGWSDRATGVYRESVDSIPSVRKSLSPDRPKYGCLLFITNNCTILALRDLFESLEDLSRIRIIFQRTGPVDWNLSGYEMSVTTSYVVRNGSRHQLMPNSIVEMLTPSMLVTVARSGPPTIQRITLDPLRSDTPTSPRDVDMLAGAIKMVKVVELFYPQRQRAMLLRQRLHEWIPDLSTAESKYEYSYLLAAFSNVLEDSHLRFRNLGRQFKHMLPLAFEEINGSVFVAKSGIPSLHAGDKLIAIDDRPVHSIVSLWKPLISSSISTEIPIEIFGNLFTPGFVSFGHLGDSLAITVENNHEVRRIMCTRTLEIMEFDSFVLQGNDSHWLTSDSLMYVNLGLIQNSLQLKKIIGSGPRGLIVDIRYPPQIRNLFRVIPVLCADSVPSPLYRIPQRSGKDPDSLSWFETQSAMPGSKDGYRGPLVIIIDRHLMSHTEDFLIRMRSRRRTSFVGRATKGCDGNMTFITLPFSELVSFTGMEVLMSDSTLFNGVGLIPDRVAFPDSASIVSGKDNTIEAAFEVLRKDLLDGNR